MAHNRADYTAKLVREYNQAWRERRRRLNGRDPLWAEEVQEQAWDTFSAAQKRLVERVQVLQEELDKASTKASQMRRQGACQTCKRSVPEVTFATPRSRVCE